MAEVPSPGSPAGRRLPSWVGAGAFFLAIFVAITYPLILGPHRAIVSNHGDGFFDMLLFWYAARGELMKPEVTTLFHPFGVALGAEQAYWLVPYMSVPLQWFLPLPAVFNLLGATFFVSSGVAMFLVARETGARPCGAVVAGALLVLSPAYLTELSQGIPENMGMQWLLLYVWCGLRLRVKSSRSLALGAATTFTLTWLTSWYLGAFAVVLTALLPLRRLLPALVLAGLVLVPPLMHSIAGGAGGNQSYDPAVARGLVTRTMLIPDSILGEFHMPAHRQGTRQVLGDSVDLSVLLTRWRSGGLRDVLPGLLLWGLAALGCYRNPRRTWAWGGLAALFVLLSLGPYLFWQGQYVTWLPTEWLYTHVGPFARMRPCRWMLAATLSLCILAAHAVPRWSSSRAGYALVAALVGLQGFELFAVQAAPHRLVLAPATVPTYYQRLAREAGNAAIIEMPLFPYTLQTGLHMYYQSVHHHPMLNYNFVTPRSSGRLEEFAQRNSVVKALIGEPGPVHREHAEALSRMGFRYLLLHTECFPPPEEPGRADLFSSLLYDRLCSMYGPPQDQGDGVLQFDMGKTSSAAWTGSGRLRDEEAIRHVVCSGLAPPASADERTYALGTASDGSRFSELRAWVCGDVTRLEVRQAGVSVGSASHSGSRWNWLRIPLARPPGPAGSRPLEVSVTLPGAPRGPAPTLLSQVHLWAPPAGKSAP